MKKLIVVIASFCSFINGYSQDTIQFTSKEKIAVKVSEIGINDIKYHRFDNLDGPQYIVTKKDIMFVKFANGQVDNFQEAVVVTPQQTNNDYVETPAGPTKIEIYGRRLSYNYHTLNDTKLLMLIQNYPTPEGKLRLTNEFTTMKKYKATQLTVGFVGLGLALLSPIIAGYFASETPSNGQLFLKNNKVDIIVAGLAAGVVIGVTGSAISSAFKAKRNKKRIEIARLYNDMLK